MFPADDILLARGKYSTLNRERRVQVERIQKTANHAMAQIHTLLKLMSTHEPNVGPIADLKRCVDSLEDAGSKVVRLCEELNELHLIAWGKDEELR